MSKGSEDHRIIQLSFSSSLGEYLERVRELGAVEGTDGAIEISPTLKPIIAAMHHVLAGGEVEVRIVRGGQAKIFQELQERAEEATAETNALNQDSVQPVVTAV